MNPAFVFGTVQAFAKSRQHPTAWLIETQAATQSSPEKYGEYTVYLEEDCPDKVVYYVFVDQSGLTPQQWYEWRQKFHMSKAELQYGTAQTKLEQACKEGCGFTAELRYIQKDGELLIAKSPEAVLQDDLKFAPLYDLNLQKKLATRPDGFDYRGYRFTGLSDTIKMKSRLTATADDERFFGN